MSSITPFPSLSRIDKAIHSFNHLYIIHHIFCPNFHALMKPLIHSFIHLYAIHHILRPLFGALIKPFIHSFIHSSICYPSHPSPSLPRIYKAIEREIRLLRKFEDRRKNGEDRVKDAESANEELRKELQRSKEQVEDLQQVRHEAGVADVKDHVENMQQVRWESGVAGAKNQVKSLQQIRQGAVVTSAGAYETVEEESLQQIKRELGVPTISMG